MNAAMFQVQFWYSQMVHKGIFAHGGNAGHDDDGKD